MTLAVRTEGVIAWQGRMLVYHREAGGGWRLRYLGEEDEVHPGPELIAALEADIRHQERKQHAAD